MEKLFKSKLREKRWNELVDFFEKVKPKIESKQYLIMFDDEVWNPESLTIDVEEKDIYMSDYESGNGKSSITHQSFFRDDEYDCKKTASAIISGIKKRLKFFEKSSIDI